MWEYARGVDCVPNLVEVLEKFFKTAIDYRGRIYIPKEVRRKLLIREGDRVYIKIEKDHFRVYTTKTLEAQGKC